LRRSRNPAPATPRERPDDRESQAPSAGSPEDPTTGAGLPEPQPGPAPSRSRSRQIWFSLGAFILALVVIYLIRDAIGPFVLGTFLAFLISPLVDRLDRMGVPRSVGILLIFVWLGALVAGIVLLAVPVIYAEILALRAQAPALAMSAQERLQVLQGGPIEVLGIQIDLTSMTKAAAQHANEFLLGQFGNALNFTLAAVSTVLQTILLLIIAFLVAHDHAAIRAQLRRLVPQDYRSDFDQIYSNVKSMLYAYIRGQLTIAAMVGVLVGIAITLLGLPYGAALGLLVGVAALVPYLGPVIGAVPVVLIGLATSPVKGLEVAVVYIVITGIILNFVYPKVMGDAVRLHPILVIIAFIAGFSVAGILGMFVAVPIAATLRILFDYLYPRMYGKPA
jgi:predicted PurR-regulated permease PerM